jgi:hypothetical protein
VEILLQPVLVTSFVSYRRLWGCFLKEYETKWTNTNCHSDSVSENTVGENRGIFV